MKFGKFLFNDFSLPNNLSLCPSSHIVISLTKKPIKWNIGFYSHVSFPKLSFYCFTSSLMTWHTVESHRELWFLYRFPITSFVFNMLVLSCVLFFSISLLYYLSIIIMILSINNERSILTSSKKWSRKGIENLGCSGREDTVFYVPCICVPEKKVCKF